MDPDPKEKCCTNPCRDLQCSSKVPRLSSRVLERNRPVTDYVRVYCTPILCVPPPYRVHLSTRMLQMHRVYIGELTYSWHARRLRNFGVSTGLQFTCLSRLVEEQLLIPCAALFIVLTGQLLYYNTKIFANHLQGSNNKPVLVPRSYHYVKASSRRLSNVSDL